MNTQAIKPTITRCMVIDDESLARELIESHIAQVEDLMLVASCASAIEAASVLKSEQVDLLFLDIEMPVLKGTEFYQNLAHKPRVIFTTAYREYALDGFELDAVDYLLKPITFPRFFHAVDRYFASAAGVVPAQKDTRPPVQASHIFVRKDRKQVKIEISDILYVQSMKDYIRVFTENDDHIVKEKISAFEEKLSPALTRIHRSYLINLEKVSAYSKHDIEIGDQEIPIGDSYRALFETKLSDTQKR